MAKLKRSKMKKFLNIVLILMCVLTLVRIFDSKEPRTLTTLNQNIKIEDKNLIQKDLPPHGDVKYFSLEEPVAQFSVTTPDDGKYTYLILQNISTNKNALSLFIYPNSTANIKVPLGNYEYKYARGKKWYGTDDLFGIAGTYSEGTQTVDFYITGRQIMGQTLKIFVTMNQGNTNSKQITRGSFKD
jgi:hypothetical protein